MAASLELSETARPCWHLDPGLPVSKMVTLDFCCLSVRLPPPSPPVCGTFYSRPRKLIQNWITTVQSLTKHQLHARQRSRVWETKLKDYTFYACVYMYIGLSWWLRWEGICLQCRRPGFNPWVGKIPWRREWLPTPVSLPGKSHV